MAFVTLLRDHGVHDCMVIKSIFTYVIGAILVVIVW